MIESNEPRADIRFHPMRYLWCWRCHLEMPMLDEAEFERLVARGSRSLSGLDSALAEYERITGFRETNRNAIWHHRLSLYGPPCHSCGKPLRTPIAARCVACGALRPAN